MKLNHLKYLSQTTYLEHKWEPNSSICNADFFLAFVMHISKTSVVGRCTDHRISSVEGLAQSELSCFQWKFVIRSIDCNWSITSLNHMHHNYQSILVTKGLVFMLLVSFIFLYFGDKNLNSFCIIPCFSNTYIKWDKKENKIWRSLFSC